MSELSLFTSLIQTIMKTDLDYCISVAVWENLSDVAVAKLSNNMEN